MLTARTGGPTAPCECLAVGVAVWFVLSPSVDVGCSKGGGDSHGGDHVGGHRGALLRQEDAQDGQYLESMMMLMHDQGCAVYLVRLNINVYAR